MSGIQSSAPVPAQQIPPVAERGADSFVETQLQLHKLQEQLQMVLFNFCRVLRPSIIEEHHWPCYAAAELPHIATAVLDFCEGDEDPIEHRGVSPKKRKKFIRDLRMCRLIRNAVAHCLPITEDQMMRFATSGRRIIAMVKRVLGPQYETEMAAIHDWKESQSLSTYEMSSSNALRLHDESGEASQMLKEHEKGESLKRKSEKGYSLKGESSKRIAEKQKPANTLSNPFGGPVKTNEEPTGGSTNMRAQSVEEGGQSSNAKKLSAKAKGKQPIVEPLEDESLNKVQPATSPPVLQPLYLVLKAEKQRRMREEQLAEAESERAQKAESQQKELLEGGPSQEEPTQKEPSEKKTSKEAQSTSTPPPCHSIRLVFKPEEQRTRGKQSIAGAARAPEVEEQQREPPKVESSKEGSRKESSKEAQSPAPTLSQQQPLPFLDDEPGSAAAPVNHTQGVERQQREPLEADPPQEAQPTNPHTPCCYFCLALKAEELRMHRLRHQSPPPTPYRELRHNEESPPRMCRKQTKSCRKNRQQKKAQKKAQKQAQKNLAQPPATTTLTHQELIQILTAKEARDKSWEWGLFVAVSTWLVLMETVGFVLLLGNFARPCCCGVFIL